MHFRAIGVWRIGELASETCINEAFVGRSTEKGRQDMVL